MAGIYIHIPFCRRKCHYCNFFSLASRKHRERFLHALNREAELTRDYLPGASVDTVYVGGGTPSVYHPDELAPVIAQVTARHTPAEITLELNPEDVTPDFVRALERTPFNRFSVGVQSFSDDDLRYMNRAHSGQQAIGAIRLLQEAGYENLSIDLIYGIPGSGDQQWRENLRQAFALKVPHLSAYALTVEPGTPLEWMIRRGRSAPVEEEAQVAQFRILMQMAGDQGFEQYEISNFALPGRNAIHNTNYWKRMPYLGLGPSAHSFDGSSRRWNISSLTEYLAAVENGEWRGESEWLTPEQHFNEYVMMSLRTMWGMELNALEPAMRDTSWSRRLQSFIEKGWMTESNGNCRLTGDGKLFADMIAAELFTG